LKLSTDSPGLAVAGQGMNAARHGRNLRFSADFRGMDKKSSHSAIFLLQGAAPSRKSPLTEAEETQRCGTEAEGKGSKDPVGLSGCEVAGCAKRLAALRFLCPCSLTLLFMKGYVGGLGVSAFDCLHIGPVASAMIWVSASLFVGSCCVKQHEHMNGDKDLDVCTQTLGQMCEGSTSRTVAIPFQLESLILAQNERWRQA
jgi:hypothetical protein